MALVRFLSVALLPLMFFSQADAGGEMGVNFWTVASNLPDAAPVVNLLKANGITMVRIYDADPKVLTSLANTGIKVMVMMPNANVAAAADNPSYASSWVQSNVKAYYPATQINAVAVGNEVFADPSTDKTKLVPAMTNVQAALQTLGLADAVKVSTPIKFDALKVSYPPSEGRFRDDLAQPVMKPMLDFLQRTGSYLTINAYPFFSYYSQPDQIPLDYALGNTNPGVVDYNTNLRYSSLLDAQLDATRYAMDAVGPVGVSLVVGETNWPSRGTVGGKPPGGRSRRRLLDAGDDAGSPATIPNARAYTNNVINRVLAGSTGTPYRPNADLDVYIFALFNENGKGTGADDAWSRTSGSSTPTRRRCTSSASAATAARHQARRRRAGAWRIRPRGTRSCRRRWTTRAATAPTAAPSSPAGRASSRTPRPRTPPTLQQLLPAQRPD